MPDVRIRPADRELAQIARAVSRLPQQHRIGLRERLGRQRLLEILDSVAAHRLAGQEAGPIAGADGRGHKGVGEQHSFGRQGVHVRRADVRIAHAPQADLRLVVGQKEEDVRPLPGRRVGPAGRRGWRTGHDQ